MKKLIILLLLSNIYSNVKSGPLLSSTALSDNLISSAEAPSSSLQFFNEPSEFVGIVASMLTASTSAYSSPPNSGSISIPSTILELPVSTFGSSLVGLTALALQNADSSVANISLLSDNSLKDNLISLNASSTSVDATSITAIFSTIVDIISAAILGTGELAEGVVSTLSSIENNIFNSFNSLASTTSSAENNIFNSFNSLASTTSSIENNIFNSLNSAASTTSSIENNIFNSLNTAGSTTSSIENNIFNSFNSLASTTSSITNSTSSASSNTVTLILDNLLAGISSGTNIGGTILAGIANFIYTTFTSVLNLSSSTTAFGVNEIIDTGSFAANSIADSLNSAGSLTSSAENNIFNSLNTAGSLILPPTSSSTTTLLNSSVSLPTSSVASSGPLGIIPEIISTSISAPAFASSATSSVTPLSIAPFLFFQNGINNSLASIQRQEIKDDVDKEINKENKKDNNNYIDLNNNNFIENKLFN